MKYIRPLAHYPISRKNKREPARGILICEIERTSGKREILRYDVSGMDRDEYERSLSYGANYIKQRIFGPESYDDLLEQLYERGGSCDQALVPLEVAREAGYVGPWEYRWRKLVRGLHRLLAGTTRQSGPSGGPSAPPTAGTPRTGE